MLPYIPDMELFVHKVRDGGVQRRRAVITDAARQLVDVVVVR